MKLPGCLILMCASLIPVLAGTATSPQVELKRVPDGGIQPQVAVGRDGTVHLVYFKGDPAQGDLFYVRSKDGVAFSDPIRVNSVAGSAVAVGNIRGARIAVGRRGVVYVVWNGSRVLGEPAQGRSPMLFSRLEAQGRAFEPERNLIHTAFGIDGGGGIAADQEGRVYVFWHAPVPGKQGEEFRRVWMARSLDDGKTFGAERVAWNQPTGACGCCSLDAHTDSAGRVFVLFRSAEKVVHRDIYLMESSDHGTTFRASDISKWNVGMCVMSSEAFVSGAGGTFAAWETEKQVRFGPVNVASATASDSIVARSDKVQKYPALAMDRSGSLLVAWTEGMGWKRGGTVRWQLFDRSGGRVGTVGEAEGVPTWSVVAAYPAADGKFVVLY